MIVLGADTHKRSHTIAAVAAATGELLGEQTSRRRRGSPQVLGWARGLGADGCGRSRTAGSVRVVGTFLIERGERVLRVPTTLMAGVAARGAWARQVRQHRRARGRASGAARRASHVAGGDLDGPELDLRLLVDHRERLVRHRVALNNTLQWHLHDLWPELQLPGSALFHGNWGPRIARRLARAEQTMRVRIARDELRRIRELSQTINELEAEIADLVAQVAPQLLTEPGFGPLTAAKLVGEIAGADRFASDAKLARAAGLAPIPVSSGNTNRHRLDRGGNRQINAAIHRIAVTRAALPPRDPRLHRSQARRRQEHRDAIRCLKRHLARRIWHLLQPPRPVPDQTLTPINLLT